MTIQDQLTAKLHKIRWQQDLARRGQERKEDVSPQLAEALRNEIRAALDADGKPFDVNVARRVYDLAIAARDMCVAASGTVKEAIDQIKETGGPMETLQDPDTPESAAQVSETFGARIMRELIAMVPTALRKTHEDPHAVIAAIADARERGMHDLAAKLEQKFVGTPLEQPKITTAEVVAHSYEHGFIDGSMQDNFERGTVDGHVGVDQQHWSPAYRAGFEAGRARRQISAAVPAMPAADANEFVVDPSVGIKLVRDHGGRFFELRTQGRLDDLHVYLCGCGLPIRQFEKESLDCPQRPDLLVTIGFESAADLRVQGVRP